MNERIRFLAEKAGFVFWGSEEWKPEGAVIDWSCDYSKEFELFSELLVKECAVLLEKEGVANYDEDTDVYNKLIQESKWIKEYFGVEE